MPFKTNLCTQHFIYKNLYIIRSRFNHTIEICPKNLTKNNCLKPTEQYFAIPDFFLFVNFDFKDYNILLKICNKIENIFSGNDLRLNVEKHLYDQIKSAICTLPLFTENIHKVTELFLEKEKSNKKNIFSFFKNEQSLNSDLVELRICHLKPLILLSLLHLPSSKIIKNSNFDQVEFDFYFNKKINEEKLIYVDYQESFYKNYLFNVIKKINPNIIASVTNCMLLNQNVLVITKKKDSFILFSKMMTSLLRGLVWDYELCFISKNEFIKFDKDGELQPPNFDRCIICLDSWPKASQVRSVFFDQFSFILDLDNQQYSNFGDFNEDSAAFADFVLNLSEVRFKIAFGKEKVIFSFIIRKFLFLI